MNIIIAHETGGNQNGNWFPWLKSKLENLGHQVFVLGFSAPENQSLPSWFEKFKECK